ncbi:MAG: PQQ-dependent sugar dehydrogenase [Myxococcales bacterium]|nr:PQQ-dependent sugar dehydrogenase [Myxococcales bacterium]MCB9567481.1 PQQ-dependent sugar dehydrogenase [Myxococcales bacterium]MCB9700648.1 PQQ-dependent sugar dehydrogenase [Myxococcales bacterium]
MTYIASFRSYPGSLLAALILAPALVACSGDDSGSTESSTSSATATSTSGASMTSTTDGASTTDSTSSSSTSGGTTTDSTTATSSPTTGETETGTGSTTMVEPVCPFDEVPGMPNFTTVEVADGFDRPLFVAADPSDPDRLFVVEQGGHIKILEPGMTTAPADDFLFVDVKNAVPTTIGPEQGLLGFAFHPNYPDDPRVYINYNPAGGGATPTYVDEFKLDPNDPNKVDPASRRTVIAIHQPAGNHNGGMITFGPDGYLYIGMGDGGGANDAFNTGRDPSKLLAKLLRIDVEPDGVPDTTEACNGCPTMDGFDYTIPPDNPFVGMNGFRPEIYALGFRNPWRFDFDRPTGTLYIADVGQGAWEEVDIVAQGLDYGWSDMEGFHCFGGAPCDESAGPNGVNADGLSAPITEYGHNNGRCSIAGGYVYRGCDIPGWDGIYFYGDYCTGEIWGLQWDGNAVNELGVVTGSDYQIFGSGIDGHGRSLFTTVEINQFKEPINGRVIRIAPAP